MSVTKKMALVASLSALSLGAMLTLSACDNKAAKTDSAATATAGVTAVRGDFGKLSDGTAIESVTLKNTKGITLKLITYGAAMQSLMVPDKAGTPADIIIGYDSIEGYEKTPNYTNVTVGRYANRIAGGHFTLDGKQFTTPLNDKTNTLHGGPKGWDKHVWAIKDVQQGADSASVTFTLTSPDGDEGFPGTVVAEVTYTLNENNDVAISYKATTDKPTVINLTNHGLYNLGGIPAARLATDAELKIESDAILPVDKALIPTGKEMPVKGTPFDFTSPAVVTDRVKMSDPQITLANGGIDHNYTIRGGVTSTPKLAVTLEDKTSGRGMTISTTEPGIQMYTGNFLDGKIVGKGGQSLTKYQAIAFEAQRYPDSPNHPAFPTTRLDPGQTYTQTTVQHFYTVK